MGKPMSDRGLTTVQVSLETRDLMLAWKERYAAHIGIRATSVTWDDLLLAYATSEVFPDGGIHARLPAEAP